MIFIYSPTRISVNYPTGGRYGGSTTTEAERQAQAAAEEEQRKRNALVVEANKREAARIAEIKANMRAARAARGKR